MKWSLFKINLVFFLVLMGAVNVAAATDAVLDARPDSPEETSDPLATPQDLDSTIYEDFSIPPVTVVASRLSGEKTLKDEMPQNISYKSREELNLTHPRTLQESVQDLESVVLYDGVGNGLDTTFSLRGFSEGSAVIVLVDGVRVNEVDGDILTYPLIVMKDLESLQVDRGSASPIYGSNAFAGVVHITTGRPGKKPLGVFGGMEFTSFEIFIP